MTRGAVVSGDSRFTIVRNGLENAKTAPVTDHIRMVAAIQMPVVRCNCQLVRRQFVRPGHQTMIPVIDNTMSAIPPAPLSVRPVDPPSSDS